MNLRMHTIWALIAAVTLGSAHAQSALQLTRHDGRTLAATAYAPAGICQGVALISHGAGGSEKGYAYLAQALAGWGFLTVVPAHGDSGMKALREKMHGLNVREGLADDLGGPRDAEEELGRGARLLESHKG